VAAPLSNGGQGSESGLSYLFIPANSRAVVLKDASCGKAHDAESAGLAVHLCTIMHGPSFDAPFKTLMGFRADNYM
jgi:hypothetical protein